MADEDYLVPKPEISENFSSRAIFNKKLPS
jgi:hypothetical protein